MNIFKFDGELFFLKSNSGLEDYPMTQSRNDKELPTVLLNMIEKTSNFNFRISLAEHISNLILKEDIYY